MGGGLAGLVFWSRAHFSQGFEAVAGCFLDGTSSHCRQWERPDELAIFGQFIRSWTSLSIDSLVFCIFSYRFQSDFSKIVCCFFKAVFVF